VLNEKVKELGPLETSSASKQSKPAMKFYKPPRRKLPMDLKLRSLYESVRDSKDAKDRKLSEVSAYIPERSCRRGTLTIR